VAKSRNTTQKIGNDQYPANTNKISDTKNAGYVWDTSSGWTSGFFPGTLWQVANLTGDEGLADSAAAWTSNRESWKTNTGTHDIGFVIFGSFGNGLLLGGRDEYLPVIVEAAHSLARRYSAAVGMTRSWGKLDDETSFQVIIDNLMNLELLYWVAERTGNTTLADMASSHAKRTAELWIRADGSTPHLCIFDPISGALQSPCTGTPQGLSANSTWARGQAWAIYGFAMAYRYARDASFLDAARKVADFYLRASPADLVAPWDFAAQGKEAFPDTSAAAITASGLQARATTSKPFLPWRGVLVLAFLIWLATRTAPTSPSDC
jgi:unsaturated chondroitin disaccharide hydrolase